ncbi:O-fucosyltransferase 15-like [Typha angustifolia]|uniref:O-fucosyltransferase 15-like n=1 Tax=Typha angustifolia TaxID=59011 RepID=UPI003C2EA8B1
MASDDSSPPPSSTFESLLQLEDEPLDSSSRSSIFHSRSHSTTPRSRPSSPRPVSFGSPSPSRSNPLFPSPGGLYGSLRSLRPKHLGRRKKGSQGRRRTRGILMWSGVVAFFFLMNWWMFSRLQDPALRPSGKDSALLNRTATAQTYLDNGSSNGKRKRVHRVMFTRLLALAAHALAEAESRPEPQDLWEEPLDSAVSWKPCADQRNWEASEGKNGYIIISANGGINQQRVAICNAVAITRLLNATLVVPKFLYNSVWRDTSQFSDIYQEEHFINDLKADIPIVKELPVELQSLDLEAMSSLVTDAEVMKESKPSFYVKKVMPILLKNRVIHFVGFGNRLAFDPIPFELQRLRCRCNFHALRFVHKIQETGALLVRRMQHHRPYSTPLEHNLLGQFTDKAVLDGKKMVPAKYLALHLRFEIDMAAYSMCYFGGGKDEEEELEAFRAVHFPALTLLRKSTKVPSAGFLRSEGKCPLTPEESVLMLAALGFKRSTRIYIAGAEIYGGKLRMAAISRLYPNIATKESLLSSSEIEPFRNYSSQLAALDFIMCAAADAFAMTDSGSQLSSLVSGYRMYYGGGKLPTIRPNKRRLASIFSKNGTIEWKEFEDRVRKTIRQTKQVHERPIARSIYRHPRCPECMCRIE